MDKFEKKMANKDTRNSEKEVIKKWDAEAKRGKNSKMKACPGFIDHSKRRRIELTVSCPTCKRKFCSEECYQSHKELCEAKFYLAETKDKTPLIELCKKIYNTYYEPNGCVKQVWAEMHGFKNNGCTSYGHWSLRWRHQDLAEAHRILKKNDPEFLKPFAEMDKDGL